MQSWNIFKLCKPLIFYAKSHDIFPGTKTCICPWPSEHRNISNADRNTQCTNAINYKTREPMLL